MNHEQRTIIYATRTTKDFVRKYSPFLQNEPNLLDVQMNVSLVYTRHYVNMRLRRLMKANPKQSQFKANFKRTFSYELRRVTAKKKGRPIQAGHFSAIL
ncbi:hypothetical protein ACFL1G_05075 [Planctomycetota bacterium]